MQKAPVYVKIDEYKEILDIVNMIKAKIDEAKGILHKIETLKSEEDTELDLWSNNMNDVERKVEFIDKTLFDMENE